MRRLALRLGVLWLLLVATLPAAPGGAAAPAAAPRTAAAGAASSSRRLQRQRRPQQEQQQQQQQLLPVWTRHYLLANESVELEPCSFGTHTPRAWRGRAALAPGGWQLPGTAAAQRLIWQHQHPTDCSTAKLLVYQHPGHLGIGALVDYLAYALAGALGEGRVLLMDLPSPWIRGDRKTYCHGGAMSFDECYLEPLSSCSLADVYGPDVLTKWRQTLDEGVLHEARGRLHGERIKFNTLAGENYALVPPQALAAGLLRGIRHGEKVGGIDSEVFWWRAQGAAYVMRPSARTLTVIAELKAHFFRDQAVAPGTVSVHVRRGAKTSPRGGEMGYVPDGTYRAYVAALQQAAPQQLAKMVFVSTEDATAVESFEANMTGWLVQYTSVPRDNHKGSAPFTHAPTIEALRALLNLDLTLECDGWVGTLGSSWSTLIERLRSTVRCKADRPYSDGHGKLAGLGFVRRRLQEERQHVPRSLAGSTDAMS